jgi:phage replication O-like protein O
VELNAEQPVANYGNPQIEDGYTKIANELLDAIILHDFSKRELKIVLFVLRKTYGWNKKADVMSLSQILTGTGLARTHACKSVNDLVASKVLLKQSHHKGQMIELNKKYKEWKCDQNGNSVTKTVMKCDQNGNKGVTKTGTTKDTSKNNTKEICIGILEYLNEKAAKRYKPTAANLKFISARLAEGFTEQDCLTVIDNKVREWLHGDMNQYLRPETLFNATKFSQYSGETPAPQKRNGVVL